MLLVKPEETTVILEGDFSRVKRIGENMSAGTVEVRGDVGMRAGSGMKGGVLRVQGNADDWLGREMRGGKIIVLGNAGNYAGAGYRGEKCGMRGGEIEIEGQAGAYLGEHMCGGSIRVGRRRRRLSRIRQPGRHHNHRRQHLSPWSGDDQRIDYYKGHGEDAAQLPKDGAGQDRRRQLPEVRRRSGGERKRRDLCLQSSSTVTLISQDGNRMDGCNYFGVL